MKTKVRRSIAIPSILYHDVVSSAPKELKDNFNQLVTAALEVFASIEKRKKFQEAMELMGKDDEIQSESSKISQAFLETELDGLT